MLSAAASRPAGTAASSPLNSAARASNPKPDPLESPSTLQDAQHELHEDRSSSYSHASPLLDSRGLPSPSDSSSTRHRTLLSRSNAPAPTPSRRRQLISAQNEETSGGGGGSAFGSFGRGLFRRASRSSTKSMTSLMSSPRSLSMPPPPPPPVNPDEYARRFIPDMMVERLYQGGAIVEEELTEHRAVVGFFDVAGFSSMARELDLADQRAQANSRKQNSLQSLAAQSVSGKGAEILVRQLNEMLGRMIDTIRAAGGDIIKFAGDALMVVWLYESTEEIPELVLRVTQCAIKCCEIKTSSSSTSSNPTPLNASSKSTLQRATSSMTPATTTTFGLHVGVGVGHLVAVHVGGTFQRWEFFIAGDAVTQSAHAEHDAGLDQVVLSHQAGQALLTAKESLGYVHDLTYTWLRSASSEPSNMLVERLGFTPAGQAVVSRECVFDNFKARALFKDASSSKAASAFLPGPVRETLKKDGSLRSVDSLRKLTVIFFKLHDVVLPSEFTPDTREAFMTLVQAQAKLVQESTYHYYGTLRQLILDDKGFVAIVVLGLPPLFHEDNAVRAVNVAARLLSIHKVRASAGICTGTVFCGVVGNEKRAEYSVAGSCINLAARLMAKAGPGEIWVDAATKHESDEIISYKSLPPVQLKGFEKPVEVFAPRTPGLTKQLVATSSSSISSPAPQRATPSPAAAAALSLAQSESTHHAASPAAPPPTKANPMGSFNATHATTTATNHATGISRSRLVGMERERAALRRVCWATPALRAATSTPPAFWPSPGSSDPTISPIRALLLEGDAGSGKTHLLDLAKSRETTNAKYVFATRADASEILTPFHGWRAVLSGMLGLHRPAPAATTTTTNNNNSSKLITPASSESTLAHLVAAATHSKAEESSETKSRLPDDNLDEEVATLSSRGVSIKRHVSEGTETTTISPDRAGGALASSPGGGGMRRARTATTGRGSGMDSILGPDVEHSMVTLERGYSEESLIPAAAAPHEPEPPLHAAPPPPPPASEASNHLKAKKTGPATSSGGGSAPAATTTTTTGRKSVISRGVAALVSKLASGTATTHAASSSASHLGSSSQHAPSNAMSEPEESTPPPLPESHPVAGPTSAGLPRHDSAAPSSTTTDRSLLLNGLCARGLYASPAAAHQALSAALAAVLPSLQAVPGVSSSFEAPIPEDETATSPGPRRSSLVALPHKSPNEAAMEAMLVLLEEIGLAGFTLILVDDAQYLDKWSWELVRRAAEMRPLSWRGEHRVRFVVAYRPFARGNNNNNNANEKPNALHPLDYLTGNSSLAGHPNHNNSNQDLSSAAHANASTTTSANNATSTSTPNSVTRPIGQLLMSPVTALGTSTHRRKSVTLLPTSETSAHGVGSLASSQHPEGPRADLGDTVLHLVVSSLTQRDCSVLLGNLHHVSVGGNLLKFLYAKSSGNPRALMECYKALSEQGIIEVDPTTGSVEETTSLEDAGELVFIIPSHLRAKLLKTFDDLGTREQNVLKLASVVGSKSSRVLLEYLHYHFAASSRDALSLASSSTELGLGLAELQRRGFLRPSQDEEVLARTPERAEFAEFWNFESLLGLTANNVRFLVYNGMLHSERHWGHQAVLNWYLQQTEPRGLHLLDPNALGTHAIGAERLDLAYKCFRETLYRLAFASSAGGEVVVPPTVNVAHQAQSVYHTCVDLCTDMDAAQRVKLDLDLAVVLTQHDKLEEAKKLLYHIAEVLNLPTTTAREPGRSWRQLFASCFPARAPPRAAYMPRDPFASLPPVEEAAEMRVAGESALKLLRRIQRAQAEQARRAEILHNFAKDVLNDGL